MKRIYIAGPISGMPQYNRPAFKHAKGILRAYGYQPVSPLDLVPEDEPEQPYLYYIKQGLELLDSCQAALFLPGWRRSPGARIERIFARREGKDIYELRENDTIKAV